MSETVKTVIFAAVAVVAVLAAVFTYPKQEDYRPPDLLGKPLFADFTDPSTAAELAISKFSEDLGQLTEFDSGPQCEIRSLVDPLQLELPGGCRSSDARRRHQPDRLAGARHRVRGQQGPPGLRRD